MQTVPLRTRLLPLYLVLALTAVSALSFLLPVASTTDNPTATHWRAFASILLTCLFIAATVMFLRSSRNFKPDIRSSYRFMAIGFMTFTITLVQFIFWGLLDLWTSPWAQSGSGLLPIAIACIFVYAGTRKFSKTLGIKSIMNSFWFVSGVSVAVAAVMYVLAGSYVQYDLEGTDIYIAICAFGSAYLFFAASVVHKISGRIGSYYAGAMRALTVGLFALFIETSHEAINTFWFNNGDAYTDYGYYLIPFVVAGALLVRAGYAFRMLPVQASGDHAETANASEANSRDYIDSIVEVAGLVSKIQDVDPILDDLRSTTARLGPNDELTQDEKSKLLKTYHRIEDYLVEKDAIRTFTKEEIRQHVTPAFRAVIQR